MVVQDDTASEAKVNKLQSLGSKNELAEYNLDDYDEDDKPGGSSFTPVPFTLTNRQWLNYIRSGYIQQYKRPIILCR